MASTLPISSGTSAERIIRSLLLSLFVDVFAVLYLYDGYVGYAHDNAVQLAALMGLPASSAPSPNPQLTAKRGRELSQEIRIGQALDKLVAELGAPGIHQPDAAYFLGPGGWLKVDLNQDRANGAKWHDGPHTESDLSIQRLIGWILVVLGFAATLNLGRVLSTRAALTDAGLQLTGKPLVPFDAMTALRMPSSDAGVSQLDYTHNNQPATIRLDPYMYKNASAIAQAIKQHKGF